jgi:hypothetical protein
MAVFAGLLRQQIPLMMISYVLLECGNKAARRPYRPQVIALRQRLSADGNLIELTPADINQVWADYARRADTLARLAPLIMSPSPLCAAWA